MFGHNRSAELPYDYNTEFHSQFPLPDGGGAQTSFPPPPLFIPPLANPGGTLRSEIGYSSSGCSSYGGSPTSIANYSDPIIIQRSISHKNLELEVYSSSAPPYGDSWDATSVRKVLSTGDLQQGQGTNSAAHGQRSSSPLVNESSIIESMNRASPYSPEEKKERIERYRSKRNLRNFNKKIKYECRKTLADSRPRIRGRFAKNDEIEKAAESESQWDHATLEQDDDDDDHNWINFLDAFSANLMP
ncbi:hypothetical protein C2S51_023109 [Perilla frutescens var. frutescens]|nr:hypothetical protein C2S51_023109 [Perilla frutescens var. frutescens]